MIINKHINALNFMCFSMLRILSIYCRNNFLKNIDFELTIRSIIKLCEKKFNQVEKTEEDR